jgi:(1->4)-alpha-D-glucan 1-alpha-D-glucosylmutase
MPLLFQQGDYQPLQADGEHSRKICAFSRSFESTIMVMVVPRLCNDLIGTVGAFPFGPKVWKDTWLRLLRSVGELHNIFTGKKLMPSKENGVLHLKISDVLETFPVAILVGRGEPAALDTH